jgi:acetoin utilization protein AcuB
MNRYPTTVSQIDTLLDARELMLRGGFRHLPVLDDNQRLVGVLTEGDIARHQSRTGESIWSSPTDSVEMAMTRKVHTAGPKDTLTESAARMALEKVSCLPVTEYGRLIGLVTTTDVLAAEARASLESVGRPGPRVGEVMTVEPQTVHPEDHLLDAAARMFQYRIRHLPVIDGEGHVIGMLSDRDVRSTIGDPTKAVVDDSGFPATLLRVQDAMSQPATVTSAAESCRVAAKALVDLHVGAVPVADENNFLVGIVSYEDLLRAFAERPAH